MPFGISQVLIFLALLLLASVAWPWWREFKRVRRLQAKYQSDPDLLADILDQVIWEGESAQQLLDSLGRPQEVQSLVRKTKQKEIWKYGHEGGNRYRLRVTLDDNLVVSWQLR